MLNSYDEWSPLKEVIVGSSFDSMELNLDLSFKLFFHDNGHYFWRKDKNNKVLIKQKYVDELNEDLEGLVKVLEDNDIVVKRPKKLSGIYKIKTPYWEQTHIPALNVRDLVLILGDTIIETAPSVRCRYFETDLMKDLFYEYYQQGANWISMPKPMLTDSSFDFSYITDKGIDVEEEFPQVESSFDVGFEMMIDAAQCMRFGKDIIVNVSNRNHLLGYKWLERNFGDKFKFHKLRSVADNHIDSLIVPLCEGVLLLRNKSYLNIIPDFLKEWKILYPPEPMSDNFPEYNSDDVMLASKYVDINVLSIDGKRIVVNSLYPELSDFLYKEGFIPIPVQHRHRRLFAGGFHCFTLDIIRS